MKPTAKLLLVLCLASVTRSRAEETPEEDHCDADWDGKVEYKEEGEKEPETPAESEPSTSEELPAEGGEEPPSKEPEEGGEKEQPGKEEPEPSKDVEKSDPRNTYQKTYGLVEGATKVDDIQDGYLMGSLNNRLQEHIRNPIIAAAGRLGSFKKIEHCFKSMKQDLSKEIEASKKEFADCKKKEDSSYQCMVKMEPGFAAHVKAIGEKIVQCMQSKSG